MNQLARAKSYIDRMPGAVSGSGGHDQNHVHGSGSRVIRNDAGTDLMLVMNMNTSSGSGNEQLRRSAEIVVKNLATAFSVNDVVDVGCGDGTWLSVFPGKRVGLDRKRRTIPGSMDWFHAVDFEKQYMIPRRPLAICLEVAEHLSTGAGEVLIDRLCHSVKTVIWSAAIPGQGGFGHVNEQWPSYWAYRFQQFGFYPSTKLRSSLWGESYLLPWYHHILVYTRQEVEHEEIDVVHPAMFNHMSLSRLCSWITQRS